MKKYIITTEQIWPLVLEYKQHGDKKVANKIINDISFCVFKKAKKYKQCDFYEDLIQEGKLGIFYALQKFNPERSKNFFQFVNWYIRNQFRNYLIKQEKYNEIPTESSEIAKLMNDSENLEEKILQIEEKIILLSSFKRFSVRDQKILKQKSGLNEKPKTYEEIASNLKITKQRVAQIYTNSLKKISKNKNLKNYLEGEINAL